MPRRIPRKVGVEPVLAAPPVNDQRELNDVEFEYFYSLVNLMAVIEARKRHERNMAAILVSYLIYGVLTQKDGNLLVQSYFFKIISSISFKVYDVITQSGGYLLVRSHFFRIIYKISFILKDSILLRSFIAGLLTFSLLIFIWRAVWFHGFTKKYSRYMEYSWAEIFLHEKLVQLDLITFEREVLAEVKKIDRGKNLIINDLILFSGFTVMLALATHLYPHEWSGLSPTPFFTKILNLSAPFIIFLILAFYYQREYKSLRVTEDSHSQFVASLQTIFSPYGLALEVPANEHLTQVCFISLEEDLKFQLPIETFIAELRKFLAEILASDKGAICDYKPKDRQIVLIGWKVISEAEVKRLGDQFLHRIRSLEEAFCFFKAADKFIAHHCVRDAPRPRFFFDLNRAQPQPCISFEWPGERATLYAEKTYKYLSQKWATYATFAHSGSTLNIWIKPEVQWPLERDKYFYKILDDDKKLFRQSLAELDPRPAQPRNFAPLAPETTGLAPLRAEEDIQPKRQYPRARFRASGTLADAAAVGGRRAAGITSVAEPLIHWDGVNIAYSPQEQISRQTYKEGDEYRPLVVKLKNPSDPVRNLFAIWDPRRLERLTQRELNTFYLTFIAATIVQRKSRSGFIRKEHQLKLKYTGMGWRILFEEINRNPQGQLLLGIQGLYSHQASDRTYRR